jgi:hypothetical protein
MKAQLKLLATLLALTACGSAPLPMASPGIEPNGRMSLYDTPDKEDPVTATGVGTTTTTSGVQAATPTTPTASTQGTNAADTDESGDVSRSGGPGVTDRGMPRAFAPRLINTPDPCGACNRAR